MPGDPGRPLDAALVLLAHEKRAERIAAAGRVVGVRASRERRLLPLDHGLARRLRDRARSRRPASSARGAGAGGEPGPKADAAAAARRASSATSGAPHSTPLPSARSFSVWALFAAGALGARRRRRPAPPAAPRRRRRRLPGLVAGVDERLRDERWPRSTCPGTLSSALIFRSSTLMMRENRLMRSKKRARLWYVPWIWMSIGHSA